VTLICQSCAEFRCECPRGYSVLRLRCDVCGRRVISTVAACGWQHLDPCGACGGSYSEEAKQ
jgi:hypothetical protein